MGSLAERIKGSKITKNTLWLGMSEIVTRGLKFFLIVYATRVLGPNGFGQFSFALAFVALFSVVSDFGLSQLITREIAQDANNEKEYYLLLPLKLFLSLLMVALTFFYAKVTHVDSIVFQSIFILSIYMFTTTLGDFFFAFFQAKQEMKHEARSKIIQAISTSLFGVVLISIFRSQFSLSVGYAVGSFLGLIYILYLYLREGNVLFKLNTAIWKKYLIIAWPLAFSAIFVSIYNSIDSVMMGYYGQIIQVGWYNASYKLIGIALIPAALLYKSFYPAVSESFENSKEKYREIFNNYLRTSFISGFLIMIVGLIFAPLIMGTIFGSQYLSGILSLRILMVVVFIVFLTYPFNQVIIAAKMQRGIFWATFWGALTNVVLNLWLIPKYSLNGAAVATLTATSVVLLIMGYYYLRIVEGRHV